MAFSRASMPPRAGGSRLCSLASSPVWDSSTSASRKKVQGSSRACSTSSPTPAVRASVRPRRQLPSPLRLIPMAASTVTAQVESPGQPLSDELLLDLVQRQTFRYFWEGAHPLSGLALDRCHRRAEEPDTPVSIGGTGFAA